MNIPTITQYLSRKSLAALLFAVLSVWLVSSLNSDPKPADLSESPFQLTKTLIDEWQDGDLIVFIRHLERCSRVDAECLAGETGITKRSVAVGLDIAEHVNELGLSNSDIYSSPLLRTQQTSDVIFAKGIANKDFLYQCEDDFFQQALNTKQAGRNLVLVTHSSCLDELTEHFQHAEVDFDYGTTVVVNVEDLQIQQVLGFIDSNDWEKTLSPRT